MKVREAIEVMRLRYSGIYANGKKLTHPPIEKIIVKGKTETSKNRDYIRFEWEPLKKYASQKGSYKVKDNCINKTKEIIDLFNNNSGKPLVKILEMDLPE